MANISKIETPDGTTYNLKDSISGYTTNTGTVTSVAISNATNGGLTVSGSPVNDSGTITIGHSNVLSSAQTTQAVYPIKIDKNGHISAYGSAQTILSLGTGSSNAYRGDYGNTAYTHATDSSRLTTATSSGLYKVASTAQGHIASLTAVQKSDITGLGIPASDTNYYHKTGSWSGLTYTAAKVGSPDDLAFTIPTGTTATTVAVGNHTHTTSIATSSGTNQITLALGTKYAITAGGTSYVFTMPSNPNTDYRQRVTLATTSKAYITGVTTAPTSSNQDLTAVGDTGVYLTTTAGQVNATSYKVNEAVVLQYNSTTKSLDFVFL